MSRSTIQRGFLLTETLLALAVAGLVAACVLVMTVSVARAVEKGTAIRQSMLERHIAYMRCGQMLRQCERLLSLTQTTAVLWGCDHNQDGLPGLSELRVIRWDSGSKEVVWFVAPEPNVGQPELTFGFDDDFDAIASAHCGVDLAPRIMARNVTAFKIDAIEAAPGIVRGIQIQFTTDSHPSAVSVVSMFRSGV